MRQRILFLSASACLALSSVGLATAAADAADIPDPITSLEVTGQVHAPGDVLTLSASWRAPDYSAAGDSFSLPLPAGLVPMSADFPLTNDAGDVVATAHVERGIVTVTLTDFVTTHPLGISGNISLKARVSSEAKPGETITVVWGGQAQVITVGGNGTGTPVPAPLQARKYMWQSGSLVGSAIDVPGELSHPVVEDTPTNLAIVCDSVRISIGTEENARYPTAWKPVTPLDLSCSASHLTVRLPDVPADELVHLTYDSTVDPAATQAINSFTVSGSQYQAGDTVTRVLYQGNGSADGQSPSPTPPETSLPSETPSPTPTDEVTTPPVTTTPSETPSPSPTTDQPSETPTAPSTPSESATPTPTESTPTETTPPATTTPSVTPSPSATTEQPSETPSASSTPTPTESTPVETTPPATSTPSETPHPSATTPSGTAGPSESATPSDSATPGVSATPSSSAPGATQPSATVTGHAEETPQGSASTSAAPALVPAAAGPRGGGGSEASSPDAGSSPSLASTGANVIGWGLSGLGAVVAGTVLVGLRKRRRA